MVVTLGPGKFYGSSLPRPRIYANTKLNPERVDPPVPVMDPLLSWANDAHWSMGGLSFKRLRLQGRIEGSVTKLRKEREKMAKSQTKYCLNNSGTNNKKRSASVSPPPDPVALKKRRFLALSDEEEGEEVHKVVEKEKGSYRRKLIKDFDRVAGITDSAGTKTSSKVKSEIRTSPRLIKGGLK
ncbi:uncharacterized protein LOC123196370 [Mangifera indica]|uniref:uncharacterized protein LOC123196370 n=1 Tax=Mangifera indica TaxID=29780 RepID=UPI001CFB3DFE|nr:uncharacterized protein LOC123196370 [Mangifera indica]